MTKRLFFSFFLITSLVSFHEFCIAEQVFPDGSRKLLIGTKQAPPFAMKDSEGKWTGISIDLWKEIAAELGIEYELREYDLKGLLAAVTDGSVDAAVAALTVTAERDKIMDFSHPFHTSGLGIAVKEKGNHWLNVIRGFFSIGFLQAVGVLLLLLLFIGALAWFFERKANPEQFEGGFFRGIFSGFWWSAVTMTTVGYGDKAPKTFGGKVLAVVWMFAAIIIISGITAAITSSLTVSQLSTSIAGVEDLYKIRVGTLTNSTSETYLNENRISHGYFPTLDDCLDALQQGEVEAVVYDAPILRYTVNKKFKGDIEVLQNTFQRQYYGIAFPSGSPLRESVNVVLLEKTGSQEWKNVLYRHFGD